MIYIVPSTDRKLSLKSSQKILDLFPDEDICFIETKQKTDKLTEKLVSWFSRKGRKVFVELRAYPRQEHLYRLSELGATMVIIWKGLGDNFVGDFFPIARLLKLKEEFPNLEFIIRYRIMCFGKERPTNVNVQTSIEVLTELVLSNKGISLELDSVRPWTGFLSRTITEEGIKFCSKRCKERGVDITVHKCGGITVLPNTNIYPCQYLPRRNRKQFFGNADRDKRCIGTLRRGIFREITPCNFCGGD